MFKSLTHLTRAACMMLGLGATCAMAAPLGANLAVLAANATGQTKGKASAAERREVESLLSRARQAMKEGNFETADSLISRAEAIPVEYGLFHVGDTPKKCRHDLSSRQGGQKQAPSLPSKKAAPEAGDLKTDPFKAREASAPPAPEKLNVDNPESLPTLGRKENPLDKTPFNRPAITEPPTAAEVDADMPAAAAIPAKLVPGDARRKCDSLILGARKALAVGDVRRASEAVAQAKAMGVEFGFHDDTPDRVEATIRKYQEVAESRTARQSTEGWRRQYSDLLMEQASSLLRWKDYAEAERLANDAAQIKVNYGPFDAKPATLLERIHAERKSTGAVAQTTPPVAAALTPSTIEAAEPSAPATAGRGAGGKEQALTLLKEARGAIAAGDFNTAERLARQAEELKVPDREFGAKDDRPWMVAIEVQKARTRNAGVTTAGGTSTVGDRYAGKTAGYDPTNDTTQNQPASARDRMPTPAQIQRTAAAEDEAPPARAAIANETSSSDQSAARRFIEEGEQALRDRDVERALSLFKEAHAIKGDLDPVSAQRLQDHLQMLSVQTRQQAPQRAPLLDEAAQKQRLIATQLSSELSRRQIEVREITEKDPRRALDILTDAKKTIEEAAGIDPDVREGLLRRVDTSIADVNKYIEKNRNQLELDAQNKAVLADVERERKQKVEVDTRLVKLIDEFNNLMDEQRYAEAEIVAKRAQEIDPDNAVVKQLVWTSAFTRRNNFNKTNFNDKENGFVMSRESIDEAAVQIDDRDPYQFGDAREWEQLTASRSKMMAQERSRRGEKELEIERKLKTPVSANFRDRPLSEVLDQLGRLADVNVFLDPQGLDAEGVSTDTPVTIDLRTEISLKSALDLILEPLHLSYVIKSEVLKITSEQMRDGEVYTATYSVADLVIPIPNFVPNANIGLTGALGKGLADAQAAQSLMAGGGFGGGGPTTAVMASNDGSNANGVINPAVLAQMQNAGSGMVRSGQPQNGMGGGLGGPGGLGGGVQADFDSLIELITTTVQPTTWDEVGGPGSIAPFETNLSLVISQTQEVHEQIRDLLEQLRRLQDLQVTIEVRFITLNDNFFERIGVDFDFNIEDNVTTDVTAVDGVHPSATVGLLQPAPGSPFPNFTADLDIPFRQESFNLATPQFGQPVDVAQFGFAILSDIEAYFLVAAAQGDRRSNVLQAPKVTLFNGQQAFVSDTSQTPFVISVIPVVGDFAAAQQPVIVVLNEGTFLTVQAVISNDRRFVRLTVVPFFSKIGDVEEFQFTGSTTTTKNTSKETDGDDSSKESDDETTTNEGVTVQLPTFAFVTVTTTVSVPDGGTVLLGGIKRLSEGRNEFGVPILSKLPYVSRLFKNVGIGRETQSLMMMVTPRIIIQEEEEERLGIQSTAMRGENTTR